MDFIRGILVQMEERNFLVRARHLARALRKNRFFCPLALVSIHYEFATPFAFQSHLNVSSLAEFSYFRKLVILNVCTWYIIAFTYI